VEARVVIALVTGATGGIGVHVARGLAARGATVTITGRDRDRGEAVAREHGLQFVQVDHALIAANQELARRFERLDVLVTNVGGLYARRTETAEGHELSLATNFLGPAALTLGLLPRVTRVVSVSSTAWNMTRGDPLGDLEAKQRYVGIEVHARAKLLSLLFTLALARRQPALRINAVNPGMAWTPMTASLTPEAVPAWRFFWPVVRWFQKRADARDAARGPLQLATESGGRSGAFFDGLEEKQIPADFRATELQDRVFELAVTCCL
jgi:NAD(P)-dependent dehydrogenase (short-subunit alcohol dehydrogenase family)